MVSHEELLVRLYESYNRRDLGPVLDSLSDSVFWPNTLEGGQIAGKPALEDYWRRQFQVIQVEVVPLSFEHMPDGRLVVRVNQTVSNQAGQPWSESVVRHVFRFEESGIIAGMVLD